ncbi:MAG: hypothetical protein OXF22_04260 [Anaerolineaceae bacterium]|nr:hypothetical protein [Anaerolineaceae bacterium]
MAFALDLERSGGAESGIEGDVVGSFACRAGLDVTAALAVGMGAGTAASLAARQLVQRRIQAAGLEFTGGFDFLPPFPPVGVLGVLEYFLRCRFGAFQIGRFPFPFRSFTQGRTFFLSSISPSPLSPGWASSSPSP